MAAVSIPKKWFQFLGRVIAYDSSEEGIMDKEKHGLIFELCGAWLDTMIRFAIKY